MTQSGIPFNIQESTKRSLDLLTDFVGKVTSSEEASKALEELKKVERGPKASAF